MKIEQYRVALASERTYTQETSRTETLRAWVGERPDFEGMATAREDVSSSARVAISDAARAALAAAQPNSEAPKSGTGEPRVDAADEVQAVDEDPINDPKLSLLVRIVEALTGRKVKVMDPAEVGRISEANQEMAKAAEAAQAQNERVGWGVEYDFHEEVYEAEHTAFSATGEILTADGKRLRFELNLQMSREFYQSTSVSLRAGDAVRKDPLVINFGGNAAELTDQKFDFDIDADGEADRVSFVGSASGFLALDRNSNGVIDDGTELFGARTGNGFAELAAFDSDGNGWIDENDAIFGQLRIWTKDSSGADQLGTLADHNIGALYLGKADTLFDLKGAQNRQHGQILSSGVWLSDDGRAGTMQQLDLFV